MSNTRDIVVDVNTIKDGQLQHIATVVWPGVPRKDEQIMLYRLGQSPADLFRVVDVVWPANLNDDGVSTEQLSVMLVVKELSC